MMSSSLRKACSALASHSLASLVSSAATLVASGLVCSAVKLLRACSRLGLGLVAQAARATLMASRAGIINCLRIIWSSFNQLRIHENRKGSGQSLHLTQAFFTEFVDALTSILHSLGSFGGLRFAFCYTSVPLGLFSQTASFVVLVILHGQISFFELVLSRLHFHRCEFGTAGADGAVDGRLRDCILLGWRVTCATGEDKGATERQRSQLETAQAFELGFGS
ncbi:hypothetical protein ALP70_05271 [Pseudomonas savastanoi]|uniref:Uncharacterized protein n=1 Tax=Pseudomonas savastanoi TaxID=29438 RepID=A0A3M5BV90_PSESS|nr:hypothetical protein ALP70_05271 [Pseudomonas savastanoi]